MVAIENRDGDGHHWLVPADNQGLPKSAPVTLWWSRKTVLVRGQKQRSELLVIRQDSGLTDRADLITLTLGQTYDLLEALNRAIERA
jgi:hypothetical protein